METATLLIRRKDQRGFAKSGGSCPNQVIGGVIFCSTQAARDAWIVRLNQRHPLRYNYFVKFLDVQGLALSFGHADWASIDHPHIHA